jgi:hypothetical protein
MNHNDDFGGCLEAVIGILVTFGIAGFCLFSIIVVQREASIIGEARCQRLGEEWHYVDGDRNPDVCATKDGRQVFYDLVK